MHKFIIFNQKAGLKSWINMNTELKKNTTNNFQKDFFKLMSNAFSGKNYGKCVSNN